MNYKKIVLIIGVILTIVLLFGCTTQQTNSNQNNATGNFAAATNNGGSQFTISVNIPCQGHAPLIKQNLNQVNGITNIYFTTPNKFTVSFDPTKTSKEQILGIEVFKEYPATVIQ